MNRDLYEKTQMATAVCVLLLFWVLLVLTFRTWY